MSTKREKYLSWDSYFMGIAFLSALRSKDPNTRNGACIVKVPENKIMSTGYNGFPYGCSDDEFPWCRDNPDEYKNKYFYVVHAELNAILNSTGLIYGCKIYIYSDKGYYPCCECAKSIIQSGIKEVILSFVIKTNTDKYNWESTQKMFKAANVKVSILDKEKINIGMDFIKNEIRLRNIV